MSNGRHVLIVDGSQIPLKQLDNIRAVTPSRGEHPARVAARLSRSTRLAIDSTFPGEMLVVWGEKAKLEELGSYPDIRNTRSAFRDPDGKLLVLTNDILVAFVPESSEADRDSLLAQLDGEVVKRADDVWTFRVNDRAEDAPLLLAYELSSESIVTFAEPDAVQAVTFHQAPQNEPRFNNQWHLQNTGQNGGTAGADVNALGAWAVTRGSSNVGVVVHDSGVDIYHPDLSPNIRPGWDFDESDDDARNNNGPHGTACAGIIAAASNGIGVVGIAPRCQIVPLRAAGAHSWSTWADTFDWASGHGQIVSCSWSITRNNTLSAAIRRAVDSGVAVFCATGNDALTTAGIAYPASMSETIAVGACTNQDVRSGYSQFGNGLDFVAPSNGGTLGIETTDIQGPRGYNTAQGIRQVIDNFGYNAGGWRVNRHPRFLADLTNNSSADVVGFGNAGVYVALNNGNGTFQAPQRVIDNFGYTAGGWRVNRHPRFLADLTNNGSADVIGFGNAGVYISLNNGNGTFQAPQRVIDNFGYTAGGWRVENHPRFLADLTNNGSADVVGFGNAGVYVSLNNGDGSFQAPQRVIDNFGYTAGGWRVNRHPRFLADLTGDGCEDIVGFGNAGVYVALNNGNGTFQAPQRVIDNFGYTAGGWRVNRHPRFLADLTGDGRADIVGFGNAGVYVALNNGDGTFQAPQRVIDNFGYTAGGWRVESHPRFLADLTGDGRADIVGFGNAGVYVALNNGDGTFQAPQLMLGNLGQNAGGWRVSRHPRFVADLTGDGSADIVGFGNAGVYFALNNGDGTLNLPGDYCNANDGTGFGGTSAATPLAAGVSALMLSVDPGLTPASIRGIMRGAAAKVDAANANYSSDGWSNQYGYGRIDAAASVDRARRPQMVIDNFGYNAGGWRVNRHPRFLADLTNNSSADVVGFGNAGVYVALNNGNGTFQAPQRVIDNFGYTAGGWRVNRHPRFLADLTNNGSADVIGFGNAGVYISLNNGNGTFQAPQRVIDNFGYTAGGWRVENHPRFLADLTNNGSADVVGFGNAGVYVSLNNGDGSFQAPQRVIDNFGYTAGGWRVNRHPRFLADLTGDGCEDIVGFGNAGVYVALNNGNGTFQAPQRVIDNFGYTAGGWRVNRHPRFLADLTGDGRADIVGFGNAGVYVALNNGDGTFQAPQRVIDNFGYTAGGWRVESHPRFLADLTGDGRADIVGFGNAGVYVALNNGDGTFQAPQLMLGNLGQNAGGWRVSRHPRFVADLTGDGSADIVGFGNAGVWFREV